MRPRTHTRPRLHELEGRDVPADVTVTYAAASQTLTVTGTDDPNQLTITADVSDPTHFFLSSTADTFNGTPSPFATPSGVRNIVVKMKAGNDSVTLAASPAIKLAGSLTVDGGDGANAVASTDLSVGGSILVTNGTNAAGTDSTRLGVVRVGRNLTIRNGDGDTNTTLSGNAAGTSVVTGTVMVTNGAGVDRTDFNDTNVGGNVVVSNGQGRGGVAGKTEFFNILNATRQTVIRGGVKVSYLDGNTNVYDGFWDLEVLGNLTVSHGTGNFTTNFNGFRINAPIVVRGSVSISGTGANTVNIGAAHNLKVGLVVGKNLTVTTGDAADTVALDKVSVGGATTLSLGAGANTVQIDDSSFAGTFRLTTGGDADVVRLDTAVGSARMTTFERAVRMSLGAGIDSLVLGGNADNAQGVVCLSSCVVKHGAEGEVATRFGRDWYPFGPGLQWLV